jgi:hypothetical protein
VSDEAGDRLRLCADQTVAWFRGHGSAPHSPVILCRSLARHPRWTCTHTAFHPLVMTNSGRWSLAWLSADPYIPMARDDRDGTVRLNSAWALSTAASVSVEYGSD